MCLKRNCCALSINYLQGNHSYGLEAFIVTALLNMMAAAHESRILTHISSGATPFRKAILPLESCCPLITE